MGKQPKAPGEPVARLTQTHKVEVFATAANAGGDRKGERVGGWSGSQAVRHGARLAW